MKFLFIVQGEGRGHMTQSIVLSKILRSNGHEVVAVLVGKNPQRQIPEFVKSKMHAPIVTFDSPNFITDEHTKSVRIGKTIAHNLWHAPRFLKSISRIDTQVKHYKPEVIVNFYDVLAGLYFQFKAPKDVRKIAIGHQYLAHHPDFEFPEGRSIDVRTFKANTFITALKTDRRLALSFRAMENHKNILVVPPLLREEVLSAAVEKEDFILAYLNNNGFAEEIVRWHKQHPEQEIHCFWDKKEAKGRWSPHVNLTFHRLNDIKFLDYMRRCKAFCSTAGFESVCEAMYMGKPVMMVPIHNHIEQECNAIDAKKSGAGIGSTFFDLDALIDYIPKHQNSGNYEFKKWAQKAEEIFLEELCKK